jgi:D-glycero-alpha-D-manno-heptose-7-phosphate kinase
MGSSSSFTVGLIKLCCEITKSPMTKHEIADLASKIEIEDLQEPIGKQDQFAASFGGINIFEFLQNGTTKVTDLQIKTNTVNRLEQNLRLYYTGIQRSASSVLEHQKEKMSNRATRSIISQMVDLVWDLKNELIHDNVDGLGEILDVGWGLKRSVSSKISNDDIDEVYSHAKKCGASGGKLLGAGAGGFLLFYIPEEKLDQFDKNFNVKLKRMDIKFDFCGSQIVYNDEK